MIGLLFFATSAAFGQTTGRSSVRVITAPQVVVDPDVSSVLVLLNSANTACNAGITFHLGNGNLAQAPLLVNGQNLGNPFQVQVPAWGAQTLRVTPGSTQSFEGATTINVQTPACANAFKAQIQYQIRTAEGELNELFSYPVPSPIPLNSCAAAPVNFDPDPADGEINVPGFANVSLNPLSGVVRTMTLFDSQGNPIETRPPDTVNGQHESGLLTDFFPDFVNGFSGSWKVCFEGQQSPSAAEPTKIDTLFIDVIQTPTIFQFDSNEHSQENPDCQPDSQTMCLDDNRFKVTVEWNQPPLFNRPGFVENVRQDDSGYFFFLDPDNTEMIVKVLDGCTINDHFWV